MGELRPLPRYRWQGPLHMSERRDVSFEEWIQECKGTDPEPRFPRLRKALSYLWHVQYAVRGGECDPYE